ncbi:MAG TPA: YjbQ family protein [Candidatus Methanoperedenaceae archaeon]|nr:YjbQ family protein [Candidatus Methanoperedenaceae archaeon]
MIGLRTSHKSELVDITEDVSSIVRDSGADKGICIISTRHTTSGIIINENESGLVSDILAMLRRLVPEGGGYAHDRIDNNAHAHLQAVLLNSSVTVPIEKGSLLLGTWQRVFFVELDGPRSRKVHVSVVRG